MWLRGLYVCVSFAEPYSSKAALRGNTLNICHKQTPSQYYWNIIKNDVKRHSLPILKALSSTGG